MLPFININILYLYYHKLYCGTLNSCNKSLKFWTHSLLYNYAPKIWLRFSLKICNPLRGGSGGAVNNKGYYIYGPSQEKLLEEYNIGVQLGGSGGMPPQEILKIALSETEHFQHLTFRLIFKYEHHDILHL